MNMVHFVSFLIGLVAGVHPVEVSVNGMVARVEIRLDGEAVATLHEAPWRTEVDLGPDLKPALLEAVAFDAAGRMTGRDRQWLNLPSPRAAVVILPSIDGTGTITGAHIHWDSAEFTEPKDVRVRLDGTRIQPDSDLTVDLRSVDHTSLHVLDVEARFPDQIVVRDQLVFGSGARSDVDLDLTAVPVIVDDPRALPPDDGWDGWFESLGTPVEVADMEKGEARIIFVRPPSLDETLESLTRALADQPDWTRGDPFGPDVRFRVIGTIPSGGPRGNARLFPVSESEPIGRRGLAHELKRARFVDLQFGLDHRADAVALAGLKAASGNHRRTVVLLLDCETDDASTHPPHLVRPYLRALRVPLVVFDFCDGGDSAGPWGPVEAISGPDRWQWAVKWLQEDLERQRIIWIPGRHLPSDISLGPAATGVEIAR